MLGVQGFGCKVYGPRIRVRLRPQQHLNRELLNPTPLRGTLPLNGLCLSPPGLLFFWGGGLGFRVFFFLGGGFFRFYRAVKVFCRA